MSKIETYKVSFAKDGVYQTHIVETDRAEEEIKNWYLNVHNAAVVIGIHLFNGISKPGQPIIRI